MGAVRVGETQEEVIASSVTAWPPENRYVVTAQVIGPTQQFSPVRDAVADVIDARVTLGQHDGVMVVVTAEPGALAQEPVGNVEAERLGVELDHFFQT